MLPRYSIFQQSYEQQGLQAPIIKDMLDARLITIWIKLLSSEYFWAKYERDKITAILKDKRDISPLQALLANNIRSKAWPTEWKPFLLAWKRTEGKILAMTNWPWNKEEIIIGDTKGNEITVNKILTTLQKQITSNPSTRSSQNSITPNWLSTKTIVNKKKDTFWRLFHRSLPLGYRLKYVESPEAEFCLWCTEKSQTPEHFALDCNLSKKIWETVYKFLNWKEQLTPPSTFEEIFYISSTQNAQKMQTLNWLHITTIYEIWCCYTSLKWGNNTFPISILLVLVKNRVAKEIQALHKTLKTDSSREKKNLCKYLKYQF
jgi:hypothetical protein